MYIQEYWKSGHKVFAIDLDDGEARISISPCKLYRMNLEAYGVDTHPQAKVFYVDFIKVSPQYRNMGYGNALMKAAIRWANISKNVLILDAIPIDTGIDQNRLIRFYLSHGFRLSKYRNNKHSMYYNSRALKMETDSLVRMVRKECKDNGVKLRLSPYSNVIAGGIKCSGFFDDKPPTLAVAVGKPEREFIPILIHEYNHMLQWKEQCPAWVNLGDSCDLLDDWLARNIELSDSDIEIIINKIIDVELDCEKRTVEFIINNYIDIDIQEYIQKSNSYILFYNLVKKTRSWYDPNRKPYMVDAVWRSMPAEFGSNNYTITMDQEEALRFCS